MTSATDQAAQIQTSGTPPFVPWPRIPRFSKESIVISEKLDGTNAQVHVSPDGTVRAGSRNRWLTPQDDNYGFAAWVQAHAVELRELGFGTHYGEWYGVGIQRGYGIFERRFALFNTFRDQVPACCAQVPVLYHGPFDAAAITACMARLKEGGSVAVPGFKNPEGIVVHLLAAKVRYKVLCENDDKHKWEQGAGPI